MVCFRGLRRRRRRKPHCNPKEIPSGVSEDVSDGDQVSTLPCSCDRCQFLLRRPRHSHFPACCTKRQHQGCCPYCAQTRQKLPAKQLPTSSINLQKELLYPTILSPILSEEIVPVSVTLSGATSIAPNKIPSDLGERNQHEEIIMVQDSGDAETLTSSIYSSSVIDATTQTSDYDMPQCTKRQDRHSSSTENKLLKMIYHNEKIKAEERLEPQNKQQPNFQQGVYLVFNEIPNAKSHSSSSAVITQPLYENASHSISGKSNEFEGSPYSPSKTPLRFTIPRNSNTVYPRYKYVKQACSRKFNVYKPVNKPPEQSTSSGHSCQEPVYNEILGISKAPTKHPNTATKLDTNNFEEAHIVEEHQRSKQKLHPEECVSLELNANSTKTRKNILKNLKSLFFMKKCNSESEDTEVNSLNSEKKAEQVKNSTKLPHDSITAEENYETKQGFQSKYEEKASLKNMSINEVKENSSEYNSKKKLSICDQYNFCVYQPKKSFVMSKIKESKRFSRREKAQKPILSSSEPKTSSTQSTSISSSYLNTSGKQLLPIPFCYLFEIIEDLETKT